MINSETRIVYSEVMGMIEMLSPQDYVKIPEEVIDFYRWHQDYNYSFKFDYTKSIDEQNISHKAKSIVIALYLKYIGTQQQNKEIYDILYKNESEAEKLKKEKYDPDKIFEDRQVSKQVINEQLPTKTEEKSFFRKIIDKIKSLFSK